MGMACLLYIYCAYVLSGNSAQDIDGNRFSSHEKRAFQKESR
jgi:hypothetical protein